jgi:hypothetical protein
MLCEHLYIDKDLVLALFAYHIVIVYSCMGMSRAPSYHHDLPWPPALLVKPAMLPWRRVHCEHGCFATDVLFAMQIDLDKVHWKLLLHD